VGTFTVETATGQDSSAVRADEGLTRIGWERVVFSDVLRIKISLVPITHES